MRDVKFSWDLWDIKFRIKNSFSVKYYLIVINKRYEVVMRDEVLMRYMKFWEIDKVSEN